MECPGEFVESLRLDGLTDGLHQALEVAQVVNGVEAATEHLTAAVEVAERGTTVMPEGIAVKVRLERPGVMGEPGVAQ